MYDGRMEIMVPSSLKMTNAFLTAQYNWASEDRRVVVNVARGGSDLEEEGLFVRLDEYYRGFCNNVSDFDCLHIKKRIVNGYAYGEIRYTSDMTGYRFYNIFMLGSLEGRELIVTLQCMDKDVKTHLHMFEIISDSLRKKRSCHDSKRQ